MTIHTTFAFAVDTHYGVHGFLRAWWFEGCTPPQPCQAGLEIALFETKELAQSAMEVEGIRGLFPDARVVEVEVEVAAVVTGVED